jgi:copper chaperone CopZ
MGATGRRISQSRGGRTTVRPTFRPFHGRAFLTLLLALLAPGAARAEVKRLAFPVSGMHSPLATRGVEEAIRQLPGVARVSADLGTGRVEVEAENTKSLNLQEVRTRAARAGFPVSGDLDIQARGRFDTGVDGRITFKVSGTTYAWQVLESGTLLEIVRAHPGLKGEYIAGFRLFENPVWNHPAISLTGWEAVPAPVTAAPSAPAKPLRPQADPSASNTKPAAPPGAGKTTQAKPATDKPSQAKPAQTKSVAASPKPPPAKAAAAKPADRKKRQDPQDSGKP